MKRLMKCVLWTMLLGLTANYGFAQTLPIQLDQNAVNPNAGRRDMRQAPQVNARVTERQAVALARERFAGTILRISLIGEGNNQRYQIRMENEGKVFTVFVHVATGRVTGGG